MSNQSLSSLTKDPDSVLDYSVDWAKWLVEEDTIATSTWTVPAGLTKDSDSHTDTTATVWLSGGGAINTQYEITNRITTTQGRTEDKSFPITMRRH